MNSKPLLALNPKSEAHNHRLQTLDPQAPNPTPYYPSTQVDRGNVRAQELYARNGYAHTPEHSAAARAWFDNPAIRRMLGAPRVLRYLKPLPRETQTGAEDTP